MWARVWVQAQARVWACRCLRWCEWCAAALRCGRSCCAAILRSWAACRARERSVALLLVMLLGMLLVMVLPMVLVMVLRMVLVLLLVWSAVARQQPTAVVEMVVAVMRRRLLLEAGRNWGQGL